MKGHVSFDEAAFARSPRREYRRLLLVFWQQPLHGSIRSEGSPLAVPIRSPLDFRDLEVEHPSALPLRSVVSVPTKAQRSRKTSFQLTVKYTGYSCLFRSTDWVPIHTARRFPPEPAQRMSPAEFRNKATRL